MEDKPVLFLKRVVLIALAFSLGLAFILYFSKPKELEDVLRTAEPAGKNEMATPKTLHYDSRENLIRQAETLPSSVQTLVRYNEEGFKPGELRIKAGSSLRFLNTGNRTLWISSVYQNGARTYPEFDGGRSLGRGEYFDFNFSKTGSWRFENSNYNFHQGSLTVE